MSFHWREDNGKLIKIFTPDELCQEIKQSLDYYYERMLAAQKRGDLTMEKAERHVKDYKDKELKEYSSRIARCPIEFNSDKEMIEYQQFKKEHQMCTGYEPMIQVWGCGIGVGYKLKCAGCGITKDITDTEAW